MKSHLSLAEQDEQSITFKTISYKETDTALVVTLDNIDYPTSKKRIRQQLFSIPELTVFLDYLKKQSRDYISITVPTDCVIHLEEW